MKLVEITWWDHCTFFENKWRSQDEIKSLSPYKVKTVGWLLNETKTHYTIVSTKAATGSCTGEFLILKGTVKKVKEL